MIARLRGKLADVPGSDLADAGRAGHSRRRAHEPGAIQYTLQGDRFGDLVQWEPRILQAMQGLPQLVDVNTDLQNKGLQASLVIDRAPRPGSGSPWR
ncbi:MAG: hypothetical protein QM796_12420 [Chthoniobacteraceae bacterium]